MRTQKVPETDVYRCFYCCKKRHKSWFYKHDVSYCKSGLSPICKECARKIAEREEYGVENGATIESMLFALRLMDKPFVQYIFDQANADFKDITPSGDPAERRTLFGYYMAHMAHSKFNNSGWADTELTIKDLQKSRLQQIAERKNAALGQDQDDIAAEAEINKKDVIRLIGYDVFANEPEPDKPRLYAELIKYLDSSPEANEDAMKVSSIVQIVKAYYQADKINDVIADIISDPMKIIENSSTLKSLQTTQKTLMDTALDLAKDNGISFAHNNKNSKGANTLSGKLKKMKEMGIREAEVNAFDIGTSEGMRKVADISNASILDQIRLNENDIPEMLSDQRILIEKWEKVAFKASEQARILLRENQDLKEYLKSIGKEDVVVSRAFLLSDEGGVNDPEIYDDEFQNMMREDGVGDVWALEESEDVSDALDDSRIDVEYSIEDDDDIEVDPDDITGDSNSEESE